MSQGIQPLHIRHRDFFVGVFLLTAILAIAALFVFAVGQKQSFEKWCRLRIRYDANTGLAQGNSVTILGTQVGYVEEVKLDEAGYISVAFRIKQRYAPLIRADSRAVVKQKGFVGDWEIELTKGNPAQPAVRPGDTLGVEFPPDLGQTIRAVDNMVRMMTLIFDSIANGRGTIGKLINQDSLHNGIMMLTRDARLTIHNVNSTLRTADTAIGVFAALGRGGAGLVDSVGGMMVRVNQLLGRVDSLTESAHSLPGSVEELLGALKRDLAETEIILKAVQNHWLLRRGVRKVRYDAAN